MNPRLSRRTPPSKEERCEAVHAAMDDGRTMVHCCPHCGAPGQVEMLRALLAADRTTSGLDCYSLALRLYTRGARVKRRTT